MCKDFIVIYCFYQCMFEVYNKIFGLVLEDCFCESVNLILSLFNYLLNMFLFLECYSLFGSFCEWYCNCLERKYFCEVLSNVYVICYVEKFCKLYDK